MGENGSEIRFEGGKATIRLRANGILHLVWTRNATLGLTDAMEVIKAGDMLSAGRSLPLLVEINGNQLTSEFRKYALKHGTASAVAAVGVTSTDRVQAAWMRRNSIFPQAYFTRREDALEWIAALPRHGEDGASSPLRFSDARK